MGPVEVPEQGSAQGRTREAAHTPSHRVEWTWVVEVFSGDLPTTEIAAANSTHHTFAMTVAPFGIRIPLYSSSVMSACGIARGTRTLQRKISFMTAARYVRFSLSCIVGSRSGPITLSISS